MCTVIAFWAPGFSTELLALYTVAQVVLLKTIIISMQYVWDDCTIAPIGTRFAHRGMGPLRLAWEPVDVA